MKAVVVLTAVLTLVVAVACQDGSPRHVWNPDPEADGKWVLESEVVTTLGFVDVSYVRHVSESPRHTHTLDGGGYSYNDHWHDPDGDYPTYWD